MTREFLSQYSIVSLVFLAALWCGGRGDSYTGELFSVAGDALRGSADIQLGGPASMQGNPVNPEDFIDARWSVSLTRADSSTAYKFRFN